MLEAHHAGGQSVPVPPLGGQLLERQLPVLYENVTP
jgi:hypothetical protein